MKYSYLLKQLEDGYDITEIIADVETRNLVGILYVANKHKDKLISEYFYELCDKDILDRSREYCSTIYKNVLAELNKREAFKKNGELKMKYR